MLARAQTYVVRIYRRYGTSGKELAGVVEVVSDGRSIRFESFDQLRSILAMRPPGGKQRRGGRSIV